MSFLSKFENLLARKQQYLIDTPFYSLTATAQIKNKAVTVLKSQYFQNNIFKENSYLDPTTLKNISGSKKLIYITSPNTQFLYRTKMDARLRKQGVEVLANFIKERFNVDLNQNKVAVIDAETGIEVTAKTKNLPENLCILGAEKKDLSLLQEELTKQKFFPTKLFFSSLLTVRGLSDYLNLIKSKKPTLVLEFSMQRSYIYIVSDNKILAAYPPTHGFKNLLNLGRRECNLPDDITTIKYLVGEKQKTQEQIDCLLQRSIADIKSYIDFFEVQIGLPIENLLVTNIPQGLEWIEENISKQLEIKTLKIDYSTWMKSRNISFPNVETIPQKPLFGIICALLNTVK